ncbi:NmrA family protein [Xylariaceae sp. FL0594]|nr:NmrA family protein [Xylariaceae sp. FL0594]
MPKGNLLVLGATSATGKLIVDRALGQGWKVTIYGRRTLPEHEANPDIKTIQGPLTSSPLLRTAIASQDAIISVIGPSSATPSFSFSFFSSSSSSPQTTNSENSPAIFPQAYALILSLMRECGVRRIVALSTYSVRVPPPSPSPTPKPQAQTQEERERVVKQQHDRFHPLMSLLTTLLWLLAYRTWKAVVDVGAVFDQFQSPHDLDWTLFRVGFLTNGPARGVVEGFLGDGRLGVSIRREDIASWTLEQVGGRDGNNNNRWLRMKPGISSA